MMFAIVSGRNAALKPRKGQLTCRTCKLRGCVGRCKWETVDCPQPTKAKVA